MSNVFFFNLQITKSIITWYSTGLSYMYSPFLQWKMPKGERPKHVTPTHTWKWTETKTRTINHHLGWILVCNSLHTDHRLSLDVLFLNSRHLTQFFLFFFLFFGSASMLEPTLEWLVALATLLTLSEECCLLMRRSGCWLCCCCGLPLLPAEERQSREMYVFFIVEVYLLLQKNRLWVNQFPVVK